MTATVTGPIYNGNGSLLAAGRVIFTRASWDSVGNRLVVKSRIVARITNGAMSQALELTTGDNGVLWYATLEYVDHTTGETISDYLGRFALVTDNVTITLESVIGADVASAPTVPDALAQCLAAAASAAASAGLAGEQTVNAAAVAAARAAAETARDQARTAAANAQAASRAPATWAILSTLTGAVDAESAEVPDTDTGTHTDPVTGEEGVPNGGKYSWSVSPVGWERIGDTGLSGKASLSDLAAEAAAREARIRVISDDAHLLVIVDGSDDALLLGSFLPDGVFQPQKWPDDISGVIFRVGEDVIDGSGDLLQIIDATDDGVFLLRIAADGTVMGKIDGVDPEAVAQAVADSSMALTRANQALSTASAGAAADLLRANAVQWIADNRFTRAAMASPPSVTILASKPSDLPQSFNGASAVHGFVGGVRDGTTDVNMISATLPGGSGSRLHWADILMTDAAKLAFEVNGDDVTGYFRLFVDEQLAVDHTKITSANGIRFIVVDFGSRKPRRLRLDMVQGSRVRALHIGATDTAWPVPAGLKMAWVADSFGEGLSDRVAYPYTPGQCWPGVCGAFLGIDNVRQCALGGTGYVNPGIGRWKFGDHIADWTTTFVPDLVVFAGSVNDTGASYYGSAASEALAVWQATRAALPNVPIIVGGLMTNPETGNAVTVENALAAAFASWADPNSHFVRICTDPTGPWLIGTGNTTAPTGAGNADIYRTGGTHLNETGDVWAGRRFAMAVFDYLTKR